MPFSANNNEPEPPLYELLLKGLLILGVAFSSALFILTLQLPFEH